MRLFVAIGAQNLNFSPADQLKKLKINLAKKELDFKFVPETNLHITLNFLGEIIPEKMPLIISELEDLVHHHEPFELKLSELSAFPQKHHGRVMWIGVQNSIKLRGLQAECEEKLRGLGLEIEARDFRPHLTVARIRSPRNLSDALSPYQGHKFGVLKVGSVEVYESVLGGAFPVYKKLWTGALSHIAR